MKVLCNEKFCKSQIDGECKKEVLNLCEGDCTDFEEKPEEELYPDIWYALIKEPGKDATWFKTRGKKLTLLGREMFERGSSISDGRTGTRLCQATDECLDICEEKKEEVLSRCAEIEKEYGISPLYEQEADNEQRD